MAASGRHGGGRGHAPRTSLGIKAGRRELDFNRTLRGRHSLLPRPFARGQPAFHVGRQILKGFGNRQLVLGVLRFGILRERLDWVTEVLGGVDDSLSLDESAAMGAGGYVPSL